MNQNKSIRIMCTQSGRSQIQNGRCGQGNCRNERANRAVVAHAFNSSISTWEAEAGLALRVTSTSSASVLELRLCAAFGSGLGL